METSLKIERILNVFGGEFKPGVLPAKATGRTSDCFAYYLYGGAEYKFGDYSFTASPQSFIYLAENSIYEMNIHENSKFICVDFEFCKRPYSQKSCVFKANANTIENQFQRMLHIWSNKSASYFPRMFSCVYNIYAEAIKAENKLYSPSNSLLSDITSYVLSNYTDPDFCVHDISTRFGISEVHLRRLFDKLLHTSPIKYINNLKLDKAKNMLKISNYSIAEIAQSSGFSDPYYFSRFFKMQTGVSPSEYRASADRAFILKQ